MISQIKRKVYNADGTFSLQSERSEEEIPSYKFGTNVNAPTYSVQKSGILEALYSGSEENSLLASTLSYADRELTNLNDDIKYKTDKSFTLEQKKKELKDRNIPEVYHSHILDRSNNREHFNKTIDETLKKRADDATLEDLGFLGSVATGLGGVAMDAPLVASMYGAPAVLLSKAAKVSLFAKKTFAKTFALGAATETAFTGGIDLVSMKDKTLLDYVFAGTVGGVASMAFKKGAEMIGEAGIKKMRVKLRSDELEKKMLDKANELRVQELKKNGSIPSTSREQEIPVGTQVDDTPVQPKKEVTIRSILDDNHKTSATPEDSPYNKPFTELTEDMYELPEMKQVGAEHLSGVAKEIRNQYLIDEADLDAEKFSYLPDYLKAFNKLNFTMAQYGRESKSAAENKLYQQIFHDSSLQTNKEDSIYLDIIRNFTRGSMEGKRADIFNPIVSEFQQEIFNGSFLHGRWGSSTSGVISRLAGEVGVRRNLKTMSKEAIKEATKRDVITMLKETRAYLPDNEMNKIADDMAEKIYNISGQTSEMYHDVLTSVHKKDFGNDKGQINKDSEYFPLNFESTIPTILSGKGMEKSDLVQFITEALVRGLEKKGMPVDIALAEEVGRSISGRLYNKAGQVFNDGNSVDGVIDDSLKEYVKSQVDSGAKVSDDILSALGYERKLTAGTDKWKLEKVDEFSRERTPFDYSYVHTTENGNKLSFEDLVSKDFISVANKYENKMSGGLALENAKVKVTSLNAREVERNKQTLEKVKQDFADTEKSYIDTPDEFKQRIFQTQGNGQLDLQKYPELDDIASKYKEIYDNFYNESFYAKNTPSEVKNALKGIKDLETRLAIAKLYKGISQIELPKGITLDGLVSDISKAIVKNEKDVMLKTGSRINLSDIVNAAISKIDENIDLNKILTPEARFDLDNIIKALENDTRNIASTLSKTDMEKILNTEKLYESTLRNGTKADRAEFKKIVESKLGKDIDNAIAKANENMVETINLSTVKNQTRAKEHIMKELSEKGASQGDIDGAMFRFDDIMKTYTARPTATDSNGVAQQVARISRHASVARLLGQVLTSMGAELGNTAYHAGVTKALSLRSIRLLQKQLLTGKMDDNLLHQIQSNTGLGSHVIKDISADRFDESLEDTMTKGARFRRWAENVSEKAADAVLMFSGMQHATSKFELDIASDIIGTIANYKGKGQSKKIDTILREVGLSEKTIEKVSALINKHSTSEKKLWSKDKKITDINLDKWEGDEDTRILFLTSLTKYVNSQIQKTLYGDKIGTKIGNQLMSNSVSFKILTDLKGYMMTAYVNSLSRLVQRRDGQQLVQLMYMAAGATAFQTMKAYINNADDEKRLKENLTPEKILKSAVATMPQVSYAPFLIDTPYTMITGDNLFSDSRYGDPLKDATAAVPMFDHISKLFDISSIPFRALSDSISDDEKTHKGVTKQDINSIFGSLPFGNYYGVKTLSRLIGDSVKEGNKEDLYRQKAKEQDKTYEDYAQERADAKIKRDAKKEEKKALEEQDSIFSGFKDLGVSLPSFNKIGESLSGLKDKVIEMISSPNVPEEKQTKIIDAANKEIFAIAEKKNVSSINTDIMQPVNVSLQDALKMKNIIETSTGDNSLSKDAIAYVNATFNDKPISDFEAKQTANTPIAIVDKETNRLNVYTANGKLAFSTPVLTGVSKQDAKNKKQAETMIDDMTDVDKITTAGKFLAAKVNTEPEEKKAYGEFMFDIKKDKYTKMSMHNTYDNEQARVNALATKSGKDNYMSWGCINVAPKDMERIAKLTKDNSLLVIITPYTNKKEQPKNVSTFRL